MVQKAKIVKNKKNNQLLVFISRKKFNLKDGKDPQFININKEDLIFQNGKRMSLKKQGGKDG